MLRRRAQPMLRPMLRRRVRPQWRLSACAMQRTTKIDYDLVLRLSLGFLVLGVHEHEWCSVGATRIQILCFFRARPRHRQLVISVEAAINCCVAYIGRYLLSTCVCMLDTNKHAQTPVSAGMHAHRHAHPRDSHTHTHAHTRTRSFCKHAHTKSMHAHRHARARARTHTHTHTRAFLSHFWLSGGLGVRAVSSDCSRSRCDARPRQTWNPKVCGSTKVQFRTLHTSHHGRSASCF